jgi:hypothetical protein
MFAMRGRGILFTTILPREGCGVPEYSNRTQVGLLCSTAFAGDRAKGMLEKYDEEIVAYVRHLLEVQKETGARQ